MKVSITTLTYNRADLIGRAIQSVLDQTFSDWELLIVDNNSQDNTEDIVEGFMNRDQRIKYFKNTENLISKGRNKGISLSAGTYIAVLDSDDEWIDKEKLKNQVDFLEHNLEYVLIGSGIKIIDEKDNFIKNVIFALEDKDIRKKILIENQFAHSSVLYRRDLAQKVGTYDENLPYPVEDFDLFLKLGLLRKMKNLEEITTSIRKHSGGISTQKKLGMAWSHFVVVLRNFGKYPNWFFAIVWAKLRILKSLF
jgi:glycosyltransferase involved in cell wall biosynthesis